MKKILALVLAAVMLTGCNANKQVSTDDTTLTMFMHFFGYCVYDEEWPIFQKASELTGVKIKGTVSESISDSSQAWNTMLASNVLPDIIHSTESNLRDLASMGGLVALDDYIDKYPNLKKFFEECPEAVIHATSSDGHIYFIPGSLSGIENNAVTSKGWFIRTDWLEKLGLEKPKTVEEFYNVLTAFKTQDPNGNGKQDEIPLFGRQEVIHDLFQIFGAHFTWHEDENGKLIHGKTEESYKNAIREIAKWYKEGLIDAEAYSRGGQAREQLLSANLGGVTHDWFSSTGKYADTYKETIPGFGWESMLPPADINGVVKEVRSRSVLHGLGWGISKDNKNIEKTLEYFDFWMSPEGRDLNAFGVEGVHHTVVDGKKVFTDEVLNAKDGVPTYMRNQGQVEIGTVGSIEGELTGMNEIAKSGFMSYEEGGFVLPEFVAPTFNDEEQDVISNVYTNIKTYIDESEQKWILGTSDVDKDWDTYVSKLKEMGIDDLTNVFNQAYERQQSILSK